MGMHYYTSPPSTARQHPKPEGLPEWPNKIPEPDPEAVEKLSAGGSTSSATRRLRRARQSWADDGLDELTFSPTMNTLSTEVVAVDGAVGRDVILQFQKDPVDSTTRYREAAGGKLPSSS